jgi:hypothetical protein
MVRWEDGIKIGSENGGNAFLRNIDKYVPLFMTSHPGVWQQPVIMRASNLA